MVKVSVILPCYKAEPYLDHIFSDLQAQRFDEGNLEFIFVDDGGSVAQASILDSLKGKDPRVVVIHKKNGGVSSARNAGLDNARGEWIMFADPDDRLKTDHVKRLYEAVTNQHAYNLSRVDIGLGGYDQHFEGEARVAHIHLDLQLMDNEPIVSAKKCFCACPELIMATSCSKIYRASFLHDNQIRFNEELSFSEDVCFNIQAFEKAHSVAPIQDSGYIYIKYQNSSACSSFLPTLKQNSIYRINKLSALKEQFGQAKDDISAYRADQLSILAYLVACNPFKKNSSFTISQCEQYLRTEIFSDVEMMRAVASRNAANDNQALRLCWWLIKSRSPWLLTIVFWCLYRMKYSLNGLFLLLKRKATA